MQNFIGQQLGNYRFIRLLGRGGFAEVYLGEHLQLKKPVAIKVLHTPLGDADLENFRREALISASLDHSHIVRISDFDIQYGVPFLVMDYAPNGSLRQQHPKGSQVPVHTIVSYVRQVADALQYLHNRKLIHRDVKPENMLLGSQNEVRLSDFGIATIAHNTSSLSTHPMVGTLTYMAPEQLKRRPRPASDQYSLGVVVYEWLCGTPPFKGDPLEIATQHLSVSPPPLRERISDISPTIEAAVLQALAKAPEDRFPSIQAFANALEQANWSMEFQDSVQLPPTRKVSLTDLSRGKLELNKRKVSRNRTVLRLGLAGSALAVILLMSLLLRFLLTPTLAMNHLPTPQPSPTATSSPIVTMTPRPSSTTKPTPKGTAQPSPTDALTSTPTSQPPSTSATTPQELYNQVTSRSPDWSDASLNEPANGWSNYTDQNGQVGCQFNGAYYAYALYNGGLGECFASNTNFKDFAFQADMNIVNGDSGGLTFRANFPPGQPSFNAPRYRYYVSQNGTYAVYVIQSNTSGYLLRCGINNSTGVSSCFDSAINRGQNHTNRLTVIAQGNMLYFYVNGHYLISGYDTTSSSGAVGVFAIDYQNASHVKFANAKVWKLP